MRPLLCVTRVFIENATDTDMYIVVALSILREKLNMEVQEPTYLLLLLASTTRSQ